MPSNVCEQSDAAVVAGLLAIGVGVSAVEQNNT